MSLLGDILSTIDARKRVLASNLRDPVGAMGLLGGALSDERRRSKRETEEAARRVKVGGGLLGLSVMPGVDSVTDMPEWEAAGLAPMGLLGAIKAYHGSPYKFDKFRMEHIGKGEGAQAYGHGLYFAENPATAKQYQHGLSDWMPEGVSVRPGSAEDRAAAWVGTAIDEGAANPIGNAKVLAKIKGQPKDVLDVLDAWNARGQKFVRGNEYEVSLRWPDAREATDPLGPQHFLDWDKPLAEQSEAVRRALENLGEKMPDSMVRKGSAAYGLMESRMRPYGTPNVVRDSAAASKALRSLGIPGIRYLDGGSRAAGQGTANYVMFDDALIEILKRNGMAP